MDDDFDSVAGNLKQRSTWLRILFMLGFGLALYVVGMVLLFITVAQALFSILTGSDNRNLRVLGADLSEYVNQILSFLTYNSETHPFPFGSFPDRAAAENAAPEEPAEATENTAPEESIDAAGPPGGASETDAQVKKNSRIPVRPGEQSTTEQHQQQEEKTMSNQEHTPQSDNDGSTDKASSEAVPSLADIKVNVNSSKKEVPELFAGLQSGRTAEEKESPSASEETENQDK